MHVSVSYIADVNSTHKKGRRGREIVIVYMKGQYDKRVMESPTFFINANERIHLP